MGISINALGSVNSQASMTGTLSIRKSTNTFEQMAGVSSSGGTSKKQLNYNHKRFEEKYGLAFTLLADPDRKVIEAYDVWKEKKNYGKISMGVVRTTYLIDEQGIIIKANDKVKAADDPENMLKELA